MDKMNLSSGTLLQYIIDHQNEYKIPCQQYTLPEVLARYVFLKMQKIQGHLIRQVQEKNSKEEILNKVLHRPVARWEQLMNPEQHLAYAIELFKKGAFIVLVDDVQIIDIDQVFYMAEHSSIQFIRLIPLTGQ